MTVLDIFLLAAVGTALFFAVRSTLRSFKSGKCPGCTGDCKKCRK